jgi:hypothetical protein
MKTLRLLAAATLAAASLSAHAVGNLADVTIYDRATGRELPVYWHEGRAYVVGRPGNEYQVEVKNRSGEELLAMMSVDGVNVITGKTASATQGGGYVLSPWENASIRGWRKSMGEIAAFYFTSLGDSYAARTGRPANVGVIGVALYQKKHAEPVPFTQAPESPWRSKDERSSADASSTAPPPSAAGTLAENKAHARQSPSAPLGTGHGRREDSRTSYVPFERRTSEPVETIAIYYDSYRNLVAQGVLPTYGAGPRNPNPWPTSFVPDPR